MKRLFTALLMLLFTAALSQKTKPVSIDSLEKQQHTLKPGPLKESKKNSYIFLLFKQRRQKGIRHCYSRPCRIKTAKERYLNLYIL